MALNISVIVPSTGHRLNLQRLLASLRQQEVESSVLFEVVVVFNGIPASKQQDYREIVENSAMSSQILFLSEKGANLARNAGLCAAKYDIVYFLDDDCELYLKKSLQHHLKLHQQKPEVFAFGGGYLLNEKAGFYDEIYHYLQMKWFLSGYLSQDGRNKRVRHLLGGNFSIKKKMATDFAIVFDNAIAYGGSEHEFFRSAFSKKLILENTDLEVKHVTHESLYTVSLKVFKQGRGKAIIDRKLGIEFDSGPSMNNDKHALLKKFYYIYFNYVFWCGYYKESGAHLKLPVHILKDVFGYLNALRFEILNRISKK